MIWMVLTAGVAASASAAATVGAGVGASPILLAREAHPGQIYRLPALYVVNTGTEASLYRLRVEELSPGKGRMVPSAWVHFGRNDMPLFSNESASVPMTLNVPADAISGSYVSDLVVGTVPQGHAAGAAVGAQAATKLLFRVGDGGGSPRSWQWWVYAVIAGVLLIGVIVALQRRYGFHLQVERRR